MTSSTCNGGYFQRSVMSARMLSRAIRVRITTAKLISLSCPVSVTPSSDPRWRRLSYLFAAAHTIGLRDVSDSTVIGDICAPYTNAYITILFSSSSSSFERLMFRAVIEHKTIDICCFKAAASTRKKKYVLGCLLGWIDGKFAARNIFL